MVNLRSFVLKALPLALVLASGCGDSATVTPAGIKDALASEVVRPAPSYLKEVIDACVPVKGSAVDPCAPGRVAVPELVSVASSFPYWIRSGLPSFTEILLDRDVATAAVHLAVRGVPQIGTSRCDIYPITVANYYGEFPFRVLHYLCFVDVTIKEYIIGTGPEELTVIMHGESIFFVSLEEWPDVQDQVLESLWDPRLRTAEAFEGKELVLLLGTPDTIAVEAFEASSIAAPIWFIQRTEDTVRAISDDYRWAQTEEERNRLNMPLNELTAQLKQAGVERNAITGGRIGIDLTLPSLVTDANFLHNFYISVGAVYNSDDATTVLPPPVPGEGDPAAPTIPVNEGTTDVTMPAPGEETPVPPSSDDAGLTIGQDTTTTTEAVSTTAPTTTAADTSVTTDVTPTVTTTTVETVEQTVVTVPSTTGSVSGATTTTVAGAVEPGGEDVAPPVDDGSSGEGASTSTSTSSSVVETTAVVAPAGSDGGSEGTFPTTVPADDEGVPPAINGGLGSQPDSPSPIDDS